MRNVRGQHPTKDWGGVLSSFQLQKREGCPWLYEKLGSEMSRDMCMYVYTRLVRAAKRWRDGRTRRKCGRYLYVHYRTLNNKKRAYGHSLAGNVHTAPLWVVFDRTKRKGPSVLHTERNDGQALSPRVRVWWRHVLMIMGCLNHLPFGLWDIGPFARALILWLSPMACHCRLRHFDSRMIVRVRGGKILYHTDASGDR